MAPSSVFAVLNLKTLARERINTDIIIEKTIIKRKEGSRRRKWADQYILSKQHSTSKLCRRPCHCAENDRRACVSPAPQVWCCESCECKPVTSRTLLEAGELDFRVFRRWDGSPFAGCFVGSMIIAAAWMEDKTKGGW